MLRARPPRLQVVIRHIGTFERQGLVHPAAGEALALEKTAPQARSLSKPTKGKG